MKAHRFMCVAVTVVLGAFLGGGDAYAGGQPISGKKLLLKSSGGKEKLVLLSKDALVSAGPIGSSADPRSLSDGGRDWGGAIALDDGTNRATLTMNSVPSPGDGWTSNGAGTSYKFGYKKGSFPAIPEPAPKVAKVRSGLLKVVSKDLGGFPVPSGTATVKVEVRVGLDKYCMEFNGTGDGSKFLAKDAIAPTACSTTDPACTGEFVGGACWYLGGVGESCDAVCAALGMSCDVATANFAGTGPGGTLLGCQSVMDALVIDATAEDDSSGGGPPDNQIGCMALPNVSGVFNTAPGSRRIVDGTTTCGGASISYARACACN